MARRLIPDIEQYLYADKQLRYRQGVTGKAGALLQDALQHRTKVVCMLLIINAHRR
jgi:hypothetical protein